jgi:hypothetical protein
MDKPLQLTKDIVSPDKHGDKFQIWIPNVDSKTGIEQPIYIFT